MTNKEYLKEQLPLWLFNRIKPLSDVEFTTHEEAVHSFSWCEAKIDTKTSISFVSWHNDKTILSELIKEEWVRNKDFLFPCTIEEALSILEIVEPEFYKFFTQRKADSCDGNYTSICQHWFEPGGDNFIDKALTWGRTVEQNAYWRAKTDFTLSPQYIAEQTVVVKKPKTIGEWLDLPENSLIKEIAEFDHRIHSSSLEGKKSCDYIGSGLTGNAVYFNLPSGNAPFVECREQQSFQPYIDWYNTHPKNPKNVAPTVALKGVNEQHSIEWWRDELAKTEPEVASFLYGEYVKQDRLHQTPKQFFAGCGNTFMGGLNWDLISIDKKVYNQCNNSKSLQPLKDALLQAKGVTIVDSVESTSTVMKGATFPCTIQERLDWMLTQPSLKPIAQFIINNSTNGNREVHGEFRNTQGNSFAYWSTGRNIIEQSCNKACSWEPFFTLYPHLRVKTAKPLSEKAINPHKQLMVECKDIKEVKQLLKWVNQESAFTHSQRLVVVYDLETLQIFHVGSTKKSQWKQIGNKIHKRVTAEEFMSEVTQVRTLTVRKERRFGGAERIAQITGLPVIELSTAQTTSWFDDVPTVTPQKINWFD